MENESMLFIEVNRLNWTSGLIEVNKAVYVKGKLTLEPFDEPVRTYHFEIGRFSMSDFFSFLDEEKFFQVRLFETTRITVDNIFLKVEEYSAEQLLGIETDHDDDPANDLHKPYSSVEYEKVARMFKADLHRQIFINGRKTIICFDEIVEQNFFVTLDETDNLEAELRATWEISIPGATLCSARLYEGEYQDFWTVELSGDPIERYFGRFVEYQLEDLIAKWIRAIDEVVAENAAFAFSRLIGLVKFEASARSLIVNKSAKTKRVREVLINNEPVEITETLVLPMEDSNGATLQFEYLQWRTSNSFDEFKDIISKPSSISVFYGEPTQYGTGYPKPDLLVLTRFLGESDEQKHLVVSREEDQLFDLWAGETNWISTDELVRILGGLNRKVSLQMDQNLTEHEQKSVERGLEVLGRMYEYWSG
jgi:hypothetical protein